MPGSWCCVRGFEAFTQDFVDIGDDHEGFRVNALDSA